MKVAYLLVKPDGSEWLPENEGPFTAKVLEFNMGEDLLTIKLQVEG